MNEQRISRIRQMEEIYDRVRKDIATLKEYEGKKVEYFTVKSCH